MMFKQSSTRFGETNAVSNLSILYGKGIFTTIAICGGACFVWGKHWRRLVSSARHLDIDLSEFSEESVKNTIAGISEREGVTNGRVRVSFLDESPSPMWGSDGNSSTRLSVVAGNSQQVAEEFRLTVSPHRVNTTSPLAGIKSCNYLEPLMSAREAARRGFDEAIRLNERDEITSACMANVFWLTGGRLYTPSLKTGCLAGTTREFILENLECEKVEVGIEALHDADEIFLTSAGIGVVQAAELEGRKLRLSDQPIMKVLPF